MSAQCSPLPQAYRALFFLKSFLYFSVLNSKWKEKSQLIGQLEEQVREMKESWDRKEVKLTQERDKALDAAK